MALRLNNLVIFHIFQKCHQVMARVDEVMNNLDQPSLCLSLLRSIAWQSKLSSRLKWRRNFYFSAKGFDFKHLCDDWREGPTGKKPLTSRCCPDVQNQPRSMKVKVTVFCGNVSNGHFVVFDILSSVLDKESVGSKVLV